MKTRFNYTGRRRIYRRDVSIHVAERGESALTCSVGQSLEDYGFPPESPLVVEAYYRDQYARFGRGTVAAPVADVLDVSAFIGAPRTYFRLKVLDSDGSGRLLGLADQIPLERPGVRDEAGDSLLPVRPGTLGQRVWEVLFDSEITGPVLVINEQIEDWRGFASSHPVFVGAVLPAVLDRVLTHILLEREHDPDPDSDEWPDRWIRMAIETTGTPISAADRAGPEARRAWIDRVLKGFCHRHRLADQLEEV